MSKPKSTRNKNRKYNPVVKPAGLYARSFEFAVPPSVNKVWLRGRWGSYKSKVYVDWQEENSKKVEASDSLRLDSEVIISISIYTGDGWRPDRDVDNCLKALIDLLVLTGVIEDDNSKIVDQISITTVRRPKGVQAYCRVEVVGKGSEFNGLEKLSNTQVKAKASRATRANTKGKPRSRKGSSRGTTVPPAS